MADKKFIIVDEDGDRVGAPPFLTKAEALEAAKARLQSSCGASGVLFIMETIVCLEATERPIAVIDV